MLEKRAMLPISILLLTNCSMQVVLSSSFNFSLVGEVTDLINHDDSIREVGIFESNINSLSQQLAKEILFSLSGYKIVTLSRYTEVFMFPEPKLDFIYFFIEHADWVRFFEFWRSYLNLSAFF